MQTLQFDKKIDVITNSENSIPISEEDSRITWKDLRGLSWIFEEEYWILFILKSPQDNTVFQNNPTHYLENYFKKTILKLKEK